MISEMFPEAISARPEGQPNERYTPWPFFQLLDGDYDFTLDVCATAESAKCEKFFTKEQDGLKQSWAGERVWCNPPFDDIEPWVEKAWRSDGAEIIVMIVPVWTDRRWWQDRVEPWRDDRKRMSWSLTTRFLGGRIRFGHPGNPDGVGVDSPPFWCCLLIWRHA